MSRILALQGATRSDIQAALALFVAQRQAEDVRVAGLIEVDAGPPGPGCAGQALRDLSAGTLHPIGQNLGRHAQACHLDASGVAAACQSVIEAIGRGCDVVVLAKFGKLEAARSGLIDAFGRAMEHGVPILTAVAPAQMAGWTAFAGGLARLAPPEAGLIEDWWRAARARTSPSNAARDHGFAVDPH